MRINSKFFKKHYIWGEKMNLFELGSAIDQELKNVVDSYELLGDKFDENEGSWFFAFENPNLIGFISYEQNKEDLNVPTVSIAVSLGEATELTQDDLVSLLDINGELINASLSIQDLDENSRGLFINRRVPAELFEPKGFLAHIEDLTVQANILLNTQEQSQTKLLEQ